MFKLIMVVTVSLLAWQAHAQTCPGAEDEPALKVKTDAGPVLMVCGFEDHEVKSPTGNRSFTDFTVFSWTSKMTQAQSVFAGEPSGTYWIKADSKGMALTELWFFSDKPEPALVHELTCSGDSCKLSSPRCILKIKRNPFPKALAKYQKKGKELGDEGEDILDQILAQAVAGDPAGLKFYEAEPLGMDPRLAEVFESNQRRIKLAKELKCQALK